jgi:peptide/nickel transport system substrate-binding protein
MLLFGNVLAPSGDLFSFWHSSERFYPGLNLALYNNKTADKLIENIRQNFDDESRDEEFLEAQELIASEYPAIFLYSPDYLYVVGAGKNLQGITPGFIAEPADRFDQVEEWHLKTRRVLR